MPDDPTDYPVSEQAGDGDAHPTAGSGGGAASPRGGANSGRRRPVDVAAELGREVRAIRSEVLDQTRALRADLDEVTALTGDTAGHLAELLPHVDDLARTLARVDGQLRTLTSGADDPNIDPPVPTPAFGWDDLDADQAAAAWQVLATWVAQVLCHDRRLTRTELPDCWPAHPRAVRELAWLRSIHVAIAPQELQAPSAVGEWHARWLPSALAAIAKAVDPLECGPARHRLTEAEYAEHRSELARAQHEQRSAPPLTTDTSAARPRYTPEHRVSTRGARRGHAGGGIDDTSITVDPGTPIPASDPAFWMPYLRDVAAEDLVRRRRGPLDFTRPTDLTEVTR